MRLSTLWLAVMCWLCLAQTLDASTFLPFRSMEDMLEASEEVAFIEVVGTFIETHADGSTFEGFEVMILESVKSVDQQNKLRIYRYSHTTPHGRFDVGGDLVLDVGSRYLVFLASTSAGLRPIAMEASIFPVIRHADGYEVIIPHPTMATRSHVLKIPGYSYSYFHPYKRNELVANLQLLEAGQKVDLVTADVNWDGLPVVINERAVPVGCDFTLDTVNSDGLVGTRWPDQNISVYSDDSDEALSYAGGLAGQVPITTSTLNAAYDAMNMTYIGTTNYVPSCSNGSVSAGFFNYANSNLNGAQSTLVISGDPCTQVPGTLPPGTSGGVLAIGGSFTSGTHTFDGSSNWRSGVFGFVVLNEGIDYLSQPNFQRMLEHELGHTIGFGHLDPIQYPNQNMNPSCCNPINTKDEQCGDYAYPLVALPVELLSFKATPDRGSVVLDWVTGAELANDYFEVERSVDGSKFLPIGRVDGAGTTQDIRNYVFTDPLPFTGTSYYRLAQIDSDGSKTHSPIEVVTQLRTAMFALVPNPITAGAPLKLSGLSDHAYEVRLLDVAGRSVYTASGSPVGGQLELEIPSTLCAGSYYLQAVSVDGIRSEILRLN